MMDQHARARLATMDFPYDGDVDANREIARRIAATARRRDTIPYGELVKGVTFRLANVARGQPFQLGELGEWTDLDRAILGNVLGRISVDSFLRGGFLASAVAVSKTTREPSEGFKALAQEAGLLRTTKGDAFVLFWTEQLNMAYDWYASHPGEV